MIYLWIHIVTGFSFFRYSECDCIFLNYLLQLGPPLHLRAILFANRNILRYMSLLLNKIKINSVVFIKFQGTAFLLIIKADVRVMTRSSNEILAAVMFSEMSRLIAPTQFVHVRIKLIIIAHHLWVVLLWSSLIGTFQRGACRRRRRQLVPPQEGGGSFTCYSLWRTHQRDTNTCLGYTQTHMTCHS